MPGQDGPTRLDHGPIDEARNPSSNPLILYKPLYINQTNKKVHVKSRRVTGKSKWIFLPGRDTVIRVGKHPELETVDMVTGESIQKIGRVEKVNCPEKKKKVEETS